ncbi:MAG: EF-hand domain-containing protein [Methylotenera sp.]|uniref:EF-hand domain-containing protein n=1 Tax=Methylotenera sp. TaxID=2051956 RepID=UPI0024879F1C|nr:EF-hand domain-containing protein [Methylotenera sp.]MDI1310007.1 EF-hand domain-containing protein [Methylotenera sp.]
MIKLTPKHILTVKHTCIAMYVCFGISLDVNAAGKTNFIAVGTVEKPVLGEEGAGDGMRQTLNLNFSPENREKIRKALDDYAKSVDQDHDRIEERRRIMQESLKERFLDADNDNDGTIDRQEATEKLPQIARLFSQVDTNQDGVISLEELEDAQSRAAERRSAAEANLELQKQQATEASLATKSKNKQASTNPKKRTY